VYYFESYLAVRNCVSPAVELLISISKYFQIVLINKYKIAQKI